MVGNNGGDRAWRASHIFLFVLVLFNAHIPKENTKNLSKHLSKVGGASTSKPKRQTNY